MHVNQSLPPPTSVILGQPSKRNKWVGASEPEDYFRLQGLRYLPTAIDTAAFITPEPQVLAKWKSKRALYWNGHGADVEFDLYVVLNITLKSFRNRMSALGEPPTFLLRQYEATKV